MDAGPAARGALEQAAHSDDPEEQTRAKGLLDRINQPPVFPGPAPAGADVDQSTSLRISAANGTRVVDFQNQGRKVHIENRPDGIHMAVDGFVDGKPITRQYDAADPDALRKQSPEAYDLWARLANSGDTVAVPGLNGGPIIIHGGTLIIPGGLPNGLPNMLPNGLANGLPGAGPPNDVEQMVADLQRQARQKNLAADQQAKVDEQINKVRNAASDLTGATVANADNSAKMQDAYLNACDELRKQLAPLGLDPGADLPPPSEKRLGVSMPDNPFGNPDGLTVGDVQPNSRAERIGLRPEDMIVAINGRLVTSVHDLRLAITENGRVKITIRRDGQEQTLEEQPKAGQ